MISLNLLPPLQKANLRYDHTYLYLRSMVLVTLVATAIISGLLLSARLLLQDHYATLLTGSNLVNERNRGIDREINDLNQKLKQVETIQSDFVKWSSVLLGLSQTIPSGVQVSYLNIEKGSRTFNLSGLAQTRDNYLQLKANLTALPYLEQVSTPFSSILRPTDVKFDLTAQLKLQELP
jgi:Tfp pilus assembly protein PilN